MTLYISKNGSNPISITDIQRGTAPGLPVEAYTTQVNNGLSQNPTPDAQITPNSQEPDELGLDLAQE
jgi:hypothetical protein